MALALEKRNDNGFAVGSFAAKTYFAELLRLVESGSVITITRNGHDIATVQSPQSKNIDKAVAAWKSLCAVGQSLAEGNPITRDDIQEWKNDGRK